MSWTNFDRWSCILLQRHILEIMSHILPPSKQTRFSVKSIFKRRFFFLSSTTAQDRLEMANKYFTKTADGTQRSSCGVAHLQTHQSFCQYLPCRSEKHLISLAFSYMRDRLNKKLKYDTSKGSVQPSSHVYTCGVQRQELTPLSTWVLRIGMKLDVNLRITAESS